jgi:hypothetical protein
MTPETHIIKIPRWHPRRVNQLLSAHWAVAARMKRSDVEMVHAYSRAVPKATAPRQVTLIITLKPGQRGGDVDSYFKSCLDSLVNLQLLTDDNRQGVTLQPVQYRRGTSTDWGTEIILQDLC